MYPSAQNLRNSDDVENPTFQPVTQQTKPTTNQSVLPSLPEESSQDPTDSKSITASQQKIDEIRILKEQQKATMKEASFMDVASMASLESKINQKTHIYSVRQISSESDGDTGIDPTIQKEQKEDEVVSQMVTSIFRGKDGSNPAIPEMASFVNKDDAASSLLPTWIQENPQPVDMPSLSRNTGADMQESVPGAHAVHTMGSTRQTNHDSGRNATLATENLQQHPNINSAIADEGNTQLPPQGSLAEARRVAMNEDDLPIATAEDGNRKGRQQSNWPFYLMGGICILLVVAAIIVGAVCGTGHCSQTVYVDGSSTMAPTTTRDAVEAPKIEIGLAIILGKNYFQHAEDIGEGNDSEIDEFMLETRQSAFHWIVNQDPMQLEFDAPNLVQRFLLVLFYYQTTRHQQWKECNPPATPQGSASIKFCYKPDIVTGESTSDSGVISGSLPVMNASGLG